jgi:hypothetical protein
MSKKSFALRLNEELFEELERWAADEFRSVNGQVEYLLTEAVKARRKSLKAKPKSEAPDDNSSKS